MLPRSPDASARVCAVCGKPQDGKFRPFCSKRCADVDLSRWLNGVYAVPGEDATERIPDEDSED